MIVVVFRSRLKEGIEETYRDEAQAVSSMARKISGYVSHKSFVADDGERVTIVEYESEEALGAWARDPRHVAAKRLGRRDFYAEYKVQICNLARESRFARE
ncbi:antibiotic biosynthesis monooxygenase [Microvirga sp. TS319]|uniref:antibiotic biosynthesis monooxygenase family protein n=1 Tax=Microvirga sp. TS319 TaxID=3241165 RepID=UPI00351A9FDC